MDVKWLDLTSQRNLLGGVTYIVVDSTVHSMSWRSGSGNRTLLLLRGNIVRLKLTPRLTEALRPVASAEIEAISLTFGVPGVLMHFAQGMGCAPMMA